MVLRVPICVQTTLKSSKNQKEGDEESTELVRVVTVKNQSQSIKVETKVGNDEKLTWWIEMEILI